MNDATTRLATVAVADRMIGELEAAGVTLGFGVVSLHNLPFLDAILRRGRMRFVPARGEAGAANMADAAARVLGVPTLLVTSTGTGAANAAGALVEAQTAGTPVIHLTGQVDSAWLDRGWGFIHEARDQLGLLRSVSKAAWRVSRPQDAVAVLREAMRVALTPPTGPVSIEMAIDVQRAAVPDAPALGRLPVLRCIADEEAVALAAAWLEQAERPLLWVGGGALEAGDAVRRIADAGVPVLSSVAGRGVLDEAHPASLGSFATSRPVAELLARADLLIVAGSHLRSNETRTYGLRMPERVVRIDVDPAAVDRGYPAALFVLGECAAVLAALSPGGRRPAWLQRAQAARADAEAISRREAGAYAALIAALEAEMPDDALWVRDITLSNSIWGNRLPRRLRPRTSVHAMGGGIGQGLAHAIGAAIAAPGRMTVLLTGDGGFMLNPGELASAVQEKINVTVLLMNDGGYGVIRNIQDAEYGARRGFVDLFNPDFAGLAASYGVGYRRLAEAAASREALAWAFGRSGVSIIEVDMAAFGGFGINFAGPPRKP